MPVEEGGDAAGTERALQPQVGRDQHVLGNAQLGEELRVLEGLDDAEGGELVGLGALEQCGPFKTSRPSLGA